MKKIDAVIAVIFIFALLSACTMPKTGGQPTTLPLETMVAETLTAIAQGAQISPTITTIENTQVLLPTDTPTPTATFTMTFTPTFTLQPSLTPTITSTPKATKTPNDPGTIDGSIYNYPYGSLPSLRIEVTDVNVWAHYSYLITAPGDTYFSIGGQYVTPGQYRVVAYDSDGNAGGCTHLVTVKSNETSTCDITDWSGSYPAHH